MPRIYEEACQLYIEEEIERGISEGKSAYSIGKEIASWVEKIFGRKVKPDTIRKRVERNMDIVHSPNPTPAPEPHEEPAEIEKPTIKNNNHKKEAKREEPLVMSEDFEEAYEAMLTAIKNAKALKWKTTSKEAAIRYVNVLIDVITI